MTPQRRRVVIFYSMLPSGEVHAHVDVHVHAYVHEHVHMLFSCMCLHGASL